jgi:hypothetical protein
VTCACYVRGHLVTFTRGVWRYEDGVAIDDDPERPCAHCGRPPTPEGYDACLGHIPGAYSACCGHMVSEPFVLRRDES